MNTVTQVSSTVSRQLSELRTDLVKEPSKTGQVIQGLC
jgi:hypothetical protein